MKIGNPSEFLHLGGRQDAFDTARVKDMKAAIAGGTFNVNAVVIAAELISANLDALVCSRSRLPSSPRSNGGPAIRNG